MPATFRSYLSSMGYNGFISYPSFNHSALEACSQDRIEKLSNTIDSLNPFEEKEIFLQLQFYRIAKIYNLILKAGYRFQKKLISHAKIKTNILFVGLAKHFRFGSQKKF